MDTTAPGQAGTKKQLVRVFVRGVTRGTAFADDVKLIFGNEPRIMFVSSMEEADIVMTDVAPDLDERISKHYFVFGSSEERLKVRDMSNVQHAWLGELSNQRIRTLFRSAVDAISENKKSVAACPA